MKRHKTQFAKTIANTISITMYECDRNVRLATHRSSDEMKDVQQNKTHKLTSCKGNLSGLILNFGKMDLEEREQSFEKILQALAEPVKKRDPRAVRLAAVVSAMMQVVGEDDASASQIYAKTVTALEGTLTVTTTKNAEAVAESLSTQVALLELLTTTVPHVQPTAILTATLPLTSRVLRAIVSYIQSISDQVVMETKDELGGANAVLRWTCRASSQLLNRLGPNTDEKTVKQFLLGTLLALFRDRRPKVRKAARGGALEVLVVGESGTVIHPVVKKTLSSYVHIELARVAKSQSAEDFNNLLHLVPFVESSIRHLNYAKLGQDVMELLTVLLQVAGSSSANDFVAAPKIQDRTPKILTIGSLLAIVTTMMEDDNLNRKAFLDEFAPRVLASLLQVKVSLVFLSCAADVEAMERCRTQLGQTLLSSSRRTITTNAELSCRVFPLCIQTVILLSRPTDDAPDDATVAQTLLVELTQVFRTELKVLMNAKPQALDSCLNGALHHTEQILLPAFKATWSVGLKCLAVLMQQIHNRVSVHDCCERIVKLRSDVPSGSRAQRDVEDAFATLVQGIGIEACWECVRFQADPNSSGMCLPHDLRTNSTYFFISDPFLTTVSNRDRSRSSVDYTGSQGRREFRSTSATSA